MDNNGRRSSNEMRERRRRRSFIKSLIILIQSVLILILAITLIILSVKYSTLVKEGGDKNTVGKNNSVQSETVSGGSTSSETVGSSETVEKPDETANWYLKLVNPDNSVTTDFINNVDLAKIDERYSSGSDSAKYFDSRAVSYLNDMCRAASDDGVSLVVISSYRTYSYQEQLFKKRVARFVNEGYSEEKATAKAATIVAVPGTSEHHMGLAVDINSVEESFENTKAFKWLKEHAADYGFIMRYPKDKQDITEIIYEPWHYRYVGVEHAKAMNSLGLCLEEYINYLKNGGTVK